MRPPREQVPGRLEGEGKRITMASRPPHAGDGVGHLSAAAVRSYTSTTASAQTQGIRPHHPGSGARHPSAAAVRSYRITAAIALIRDARHRSPRKIARGATHHPKAITVPHRDAPPRLFAGP